MTNQQQLMDFIFTSLAEKFQDTQSINQYSLGTFSDVRSERSEHLYYQEINQEIENTKQILKGRTRFFIIKSFSMENIKISIENEVWATTAGPTSKLTKAFHQADHVVLIFSVNESRSFQGFAIMESEPDPEYKKELFVVDSTKSDSIQYAGNFKVRWIVTCDFPFTLTNHFPPNVMNENMPIKQSKNGQELPYKPGNYLCTLIYNFDDKSKKILTPIETYCQSLPPTHTHQYNDKQQISNSQRPNRPDYRKPPQQRGMGGMPGPGHVGMGYQQRSRQNNMYYVKSQQQMSQHQYQQSPHYSQRQEGGIEEKKNEKYS